MSACPRSSCTPRRSRLDSSRCVAKEWRRRCGCTGTLRPLPAAQRPMRFWIARAPSRRPFLPMKRAAGPVLRVRPALAQPGAQRRDGLAAHRQHARLRALAEHAHGPVGEVEVGDVEAGELREAQPRRVEQLQHREVADARGHPSACARGGLRPGRRRASSAAASRPSARGSRRRDWFRGPFPGSGN